MNLEEIEAELESFQLGGFDCGFSEFASKYMPKLIAVAKAAKIYTESADSIRDSWPIKEVLLRLEDDK